jgi:hypothetical protein
VDALERSAFDTSIRRMRAWGCGLRKLRRPCSIPGSAMSSV